METGKNIVKTLVNLKNADETERLETKKAVLEHLQNSAIGENKEPFYEEANRLSKEIDESIEKEKKL